MPDPLSDETILKLMTLRSRFRELTALPGRSTTVEEETEIAEWIAVDKGDVIDLLGDEVLRLREERKDYETTIYGIAERTGSIAMKCVKAAREMQERCAIEADEVESDRQVRSTDSVYSEGWRDAADKVMQRIRSLQLLPEPPQG